MAHRVFERINVMPNFIHGHFIQWQLNPLFNAEGPYNFDLEIAEDPEFSTILGAKRDLGDTVFVFDDLNLVQRLSPSFFYRVLLHTADGKTFASPSISLGYTTPEQRKYAMATKIITREVLQHRSAGGEGWVLKRKPHGPARQVAVAEVDPVSGVPLTDTKFDDFGVGTPGGYFPPVPCVYSKLSNSQDKQPDPSGQGVVEVYTSEIRMPGYPLVDVRDILCDAKNGKRYNINKIEQSDFPGTEITLVQLLRVSLIPPTDTVYAIPLPIPL